MIKKIVFVGLVTLCSTIYAAGNVVGIIPQGLSLTNGSKNPKTLVNISRYELADFLETGKKPSSILDEHIYYQPWKQPSVRKRFADTLVAYLCNTVGVNKSELFSMIRDTNQTVLYELQPTDQVYSNGINSVKGVLVAAPPRNARMTRNGMEQYLLFPNGTIVYLTCANADIVEQIGEEGFIETEQSSMNGEVLVKKNPDTLVCVIPGDTVIYNHVTKKVLDPVVQYVQDTVFLKAPPQVIVYQKENTVVHNYQQIVEQPTQKVIRKTVVIEYDDPNCNCGAKPAPKGTITNICPKGSITNVCPKGSISNQGAPKGSIGY